MWGIVLHDEVVSRGNLQHAASIQRALSRETSAFPFVCWQVSAEVVECAVVIEMPDLKGRRKLGDVPLYALVQKEGD